MSETRANKALLWKGAVLTAAAALYFPKIAAVKAGDAAWWQLIVFIWPRDLEGIIITPVVLLLTFGVFALVGRRALRDGPTNRPARYGLVCAVLGLVGVIFFWLSAPIILGGLAVTLGLEARRRAGRAREARAALAVGTLAMIVGAGIWVIFE